MISIALFELLAVLAGVFLLKGRNWARWLLLLWIAFHVILPRLKLALRRAAASSAVNRGRVFPLYATGFPSISTPPRGVILRVVYQEEEYPESKQRPCLLCDRLSFAVSLHKWLASPSALSRFNFVEGRVRLSIAAVCCHCCCSPFPLRKLRSQPKHQAPAEKVIIDTDIGDDIDDAFAIALALKSPELEILGISTTFGDTEARAKIVDRLLGEAGRPNIPVLAGIPTHTTNVMNQKRYGEGRHFAKTSTSERRGLHPRSDSPQSSANHLNRYRPVDECRRAHR